jgi:hypothetical protein
MLLKASTQNPNKNSKERRKIMNARKKFLMALAIVGCAVLLVAGSIAGTVAYLTSMTGTVTNTFTVGKIEITLDEAKVNAYGEKDGTARVTDGNTYKLIPGHTYSKDPTVTVKAESEACYLFVRVVNEIADIEDDSIIGGVTIPTINDQILAKGWTALTGVPGVYYREVPYTASAETYVVFTNFTVQDDANVSAYAGKKITVTACAIQADGFADVAAAWAAAPTAFTNPTP